MGAEPRREKKEENWLEKLLVAVKLRIAILRNRITILQLWPWAKYIQNENPSEPTQRKYGVVER